MYQVCKIHTVKYMKFLSCILLFVFFASFGGALSYAAYDLPYIGTTKIYTATYEDTLVHVARDHNLGYVEIRAANPNVDPWIPGKGTKLTLPLRHILPDAAREGVIINLPEMRLYAFVKEGEAPISYPIGVGREGLDTPLGQTEVAWKKIGPTWTPTARMRAEDPELPVTMAPGPNNPLGTHAIYLGWPQYAIHGTDKPFGIGRRVSSGCIRLYPESIIKLFDVIPVGTKVRVVDQPLKLAWIDDELYLEAHPDMKQAFEMEDVGVVLKQTLNDFDLRQILKVAGSDNGGLDWRLIRRVIRERRGVPIVIGQRYFDDNNNDVDEVGAGIVAVNSSTSKTTAPRKRPRYN